MMPDQKSMYFNLKELFDFEGGLSAKKGRPPKMKVCL
jgi:hypothetical protein